MGELWYGEAEQSAVQCQNVELQYTASSRLHRARPTQRIRRQTLDALETFEILPNSTSQISIAPALVCSEKVNTQNDSALIVSASFRSQL
jgi:hypothetical protein